MIPRKEFFGNPEKAAARISPDGSKLAFIAPVDGVLNVWVAQADDLDSARAVTRDKHRGIVSYFWAYTNNHLLYTQDQDGDEDWHLYAVNLDNDEVRNLTPFEQVSARVQEVSHRFPDTILVSINDRDGHELHDIYRVNILSGKRELVQENPGFLGFMTDDQYRVRLAVTTTPDAGQLLLKPDDKAEGGWGEFIRIGSEDAMTSGPAGLDSSDRLYFLDSRDRDTAALTVIDLNSGEKTAIAENERADLEDVITHPKDRTVQAVSFTYERTEWIILDEAIRADFDYLETVEDGEIRLTSRTLDDRIWTVVYVVDNGPIRTYFYDREAKQARYLYTNNPSLENLPLVRMHSEVITSRDGLPLVSYLSLPNGSDSTNPGRPDKPVPMVLNVHGGPWTRDSWGYDPEHQLLANRGYAVLSVNFRGSTGFGKTFINLANQQWAAKMHEDLVDAVQWAVDQKIAQSDRIGIMGASYGGYAALVGLTFTPELFACGVSIVGPSNLVTLLNSPPPYWIPNMPMITTRVGNHLTEEGRELLESRSPLFFVDRIQRPLLIGQGKQDPRVKQAEADQIVEAMKERKIPVTYVLFLEEGHGFVRPENKYAFYAIIEAYLAEHLGGLCEEVGDAFQGAVFEVPSGAEQVPGLSAALAHYTPALRPDGGAGAKAE